MEGSRATAYRFIMSAMSFISASTAAIFSADEGCGRPNPRNDMLGGDIGKCAGVFDCGGGRVTASWGALCRWSCSGVRFGSWLSSRSARALEKVVQKIGSASDVGIAGFSGLALTSGPCTVALLVNDTLGGSYFPCCQKFRTAPAPRRLHPTSTRELCFL